MTETREQEILELLKNEVKPAIGCTEPIAVALAVSKSAETLNCGFREITKIDVKVSANILKNGMGVGVPGTGMVGLHIASALGVTGGKSQYLLEVLKDITEQNIEDAKQLLEKSLVYVGLAKTLRKLYVSATCYTDGHSATTIIEDAHDNISSVTYDGKTVLQKSNTSNSGENYKVKNIPDYNLSLKDIYQFINQVPIDKISFILESVTLNKKLAEEGLKNDYGLKVGKTLLGKTSEKILGKSFLIHTMAMTAAASDARMAGSTLPAMSNSGSGNQGITVTIPVINYAEKIDAQQDDLCRALALSHLTAIHIKGYLGKLSALCGCVIAATGASCGIVYLDGGNYDQMTYAIKNMIGNITGMVCDGAKVGCALKVASGVSSAIQSALLAIENISISENDGIIEKDIEKTIRNLGKIGSEGMQNTDKMILDIMVCK